MTRMAKADSPGDCAHFSTVASIYHAIRPGYPDGLFRVINGYFGRPDAPSRILEIGCGTGKATEGIAKTWPAPIDAVDPSPELISIVRARFSGERRIVFHTCKFEDFRIDDGSYDLILSATAFHWLDAGSKYAQCRRLLSKSGFLAVFWNNFMVSDEKIGEEIASIYRKHRKDAAEDASSREERRARKIGERIGEIRASGAFRHVGHHEFSHDVGMDAEQHLQLLRTFPDHAESNFPDPARFFGELREVLRRNGDRVSMNILVNLEMASPA